MQVSNHQRRRRLTSPAALAVYGLIIAGGTAAGAWANVELGANGNAAVPIALIVPGAAGLGIAGIVVGRGSARPSGGPLRPSPPPRPAITSATVTAVISPRHKALTSCSPPGTVPPSDAGEV